ncbi:hypothetical protein MBAV_005321 [Candidatus Magnetobacterium bavaricum]|uniref:Uncharacterized protein n=1 Tax=Candidatus Magnetobacterium bavaricum TaxID=29290 RepID=A0A0F3GKY1_9BACT|nr:hypothetical protein MBAV_005321 [Candidatus Magnetobacterium bavaricum]
MVWAELCWPGAVGVCQDGAAPALYDVPGDVCSHNAGTDNGCICRAYEVLCPVVIFGVVVDAGVCARVSLGVGRRLDRCKAWCLGLCRRYCRAYKLGNGCRGSNHCHGQTQGICKRAHAPAQPAYDDHGRGVVVVWVVWI